jgi:hypothetical protein
MLTCSVELIYPLYLNYLKKSNTVGWTFCRDKGRTSRRYLCAVVQVDCNSYSLFETVDYPLYNLRIKGKVRNAPWYVFSLYNRQNSRVKCSRGPDNRYLN